MSEKEWKAFEMLTETEFYQQFNPIPAPDGGELWTWQELTEWSPPSKIRGSRQVWTVSSDECETYATGIGYVNVIGYIVTKEPVEKDMVAVMDSTEDEEKCDG